MERRLAVLRYTSEYGLKSKLEKELESVRKKEHYSYWPRFMIRRVSLYAIPFLMFFTFFFCLSLTKKVGVEKANAMLDTLRLPSWDHFVASIIITIIILIVQWLCFNYKYKKQAVNHSSRTGCKLVAHFMIFILFVQLFLLVYYTEYNIFYGFLTFLILTVLPLFVDRTLGITRQNERSKLYIRRLERFDELNSTRARLGIKFEESHFIEYMKLADEADHSKNQDTVSDTSYFMTLIENKLKG